MVGMMAVRMGGLWVSLRAGATVVLTGERSVEKKVDSTAETKVMMSEIRLAACSAAKKVYSSANMTVERMVETTAAKLVVLKVDLWALKKVARRVALLADMTAEMTA